MIVVENGRKHLNSEIQVVVARVHANGGRAHDLRAPEVRRRRQPPGYAAQRGTGGMTTPASNGTTVAIVVAAGSSRRMEGQDKLFALLGDKPVLAHTLAALHAAPLETIVLVVSATAQQRCRELLRMYGFARVQEICLGGATRQESVYRGLVVAA
ncbi:MAG: hypothetical protein C4289_04435, partial [Chloroflexota bacterium]